jgi:hypothetical protein
MLLVLIRNGLFLGTLMVAANVWADEYTSAQIASQYASCQTFMALSTAQQTSVCSYSGYTLQQCISSCQTMLANTLAEDQVLNEQYNDWVNAGSAAGSSSQGAPNCNTDNDGNVSCGYVGGSSATALKCGTNKPGAFTHCTNPNGTTASVSCYTNTLGSTSCH